jgi:hypothetical protein
MSTHLTCPGCGRSLLLPGDCTAETLSCPRCLSRITNPQAPGNPTAIQTEAPAPSAPAAPSRAITASAPRIGAADLDVDVRRDSQGTSGCMIVLMVLGGLGLGLFALTGLAAGREGLMFFLGVPAVLAISSAIAVFLRPSEATAGSELGRIFRALLAISGVVVLLIVSILIFLFVVCLVNPPRFH